LDGVVVAPRLGVAIRTVELEMCADQGEAGVLLMVEARRVKCLPHALPRNRSVARCAIGTEVSRVVVVVAALAGRVFRAGELLVGARAWMTTHTRNLLV